MKRLNVIFALAVLAGAAGAQVFPVRLYGGAQADRGFALTEDAEGCFYLGGQTFSFGPGVPTSGNAIAFRTGALGIPLWARVSAGESDDEFRASVNVPDGCVFAGYTASRGAGGLDILVTKFDPLGNVLWSRVYGDAGNEMALSICTTLDGGFALTGWTSSYGPPAPPNIFVLRLDPMGMPLWLRVYWPWMTNGEDYGHSIVELPGGGFAVAGRSRVFSLQQYDPFLMRLDAAGNFKWAQTTNGEGFDDEAWSVAVDLPGRILVAGNTMAFGSAPGLTVDIFVAAFDTAGLNLWSLTYGWPAGNEVMNDDRSLCRTLDGGSVFCGYTTSVGPGLPNPNMLLVKLDPMGLWMWATSHPSPYWPGLSDDEAMPVIERAAGGYALTGYSNSWNLLGGGYDINLSTFDPVGLRPACAERVEPLLGAFPWTWWEYDTLSARPHFDSLPFIDIRLPHDSVCYDTGGVGAGERQGVVPAAGLRLAARGGAVEMELARAMPVVVAAYAADGRRLTVLARGTFAAGRHSLPLPPSLPAGACFIRALAGSAVASLKVIRH